MVIKIIMVSLIILFIYLLYISSNQAKKSAQSKKRLVDKIKNRKRD